MKRWMIAALLLMLPVAAHAFWHGSFTSAGWNIAKVGGGGFVTGYDTSADGTTRAVRTDTYGGYIWNASSSKWEQILTSSSMGADATVSNGTYIYEMVVAPNDPNRLYMWWNGYAYKTTNRAATWTKLTTYNGGVQAPNQLMTTYAGLVYQARVYGKKMAVDPQNPNVVLIGSEVSGLQMSTDGGATFTTISQVPLPSANGYQINNVGGYASGTTSIAVDTGTAGIPSGTQFFFGSVGYTTTSALASGSGTVSIAPALSASVSDNQVLQSGGGHVIAYDPTSLANCGSGGNQKCGIYVASYGNGVYHSIDGGANWTKTTGGAGSSLNIIHMVVGSDGMVYTLDQPGTSVRKYNGTTWTDISAGLTGQYESLAVDPNNANRIVAVGGGFISTSLNQGAAWSFATGAPWSPNCLGGNYERRSASDVPWLAWTQHCSMDTADIRFDPVLPGTTSRLWLTTGIGVWYYDFGSTTAAPTTQVTWNSQTAAIENLVANWILSPPGGNPTFYAWDRPVFYISDPNTYPSTHGPNGSAAINAGWSASYSPSTPTTLAGIFNYFGSVEYSGISTDGGQTWTPFATVPAGLTAGAKISGSIAVSTAASAATANILWCPSSDYHPFYSTNGGGTWTEITSAQIPNMPANGSVQGWSHNYYGDFQNCVADQVNANTFYMYNSNSPLFNNYGGIYRSTDGGATWVHTYVAGNSTAVSFPGSGFNDKVRAVPGYAGHLFYTAGGLGNPVGSSATGSFYRSTDAATATAGTQTFQAITRVSGVSAFGFGAIKPGGDYPTVYIAGFVDGTFGIWRGDGTAAQWAAGAGTGTGVTWTNLGTNPLGSFDTVKAVEGDGNTYGKVYVGFAGSGFMYYQP